jgi:hypothetical protein
MRSKGISQIYVIFLDNHIYADLWFGWSKSLLELIEGRELHNIQQEVHFQNDDSTFLLLPAIDPLPAIVRDFGFFRRPPGTLYFKA